MIKLLFSVLIIFISSTLSLAQTTKITSETAYDEYSSGKYSKAIDSYSWLIKSEPDFENYKLRGVCYYSINQYENAIADFDTALTLNPGLGTEFRIRCLRAQSNYYLGNWEKALVDFRYYLEFKNTDFYAAYMAAFAQYSLGYYTQALEAYTAMFGNTNLFPNLRIPYYYHLGLFHLETDEPEKAIRCVDQINSIDSSSSDGQILQARIYASDGDYDAATALMSRIISGDSTNLQALYLRGIYHQRNQDYYSARKDLLKYLQEVGYDREAMFDLIDVEQDMKLYASANKNFWKILKSEGPSAPLFNSIAWNHLLLANYESALLYANKSIALDEEGPNALDTRGTVYFKTGKHLLAFKDFDKAILLDPASNSSHYYKGLCYLKMGEIDKACVDWSKCTKQDFMVLDGDLPLENLMEKHCKQKGGN